VPSKHLKMFQENIYTEFGDKPGAFHTTGQTFWGQRLTPHPGTSELPGTYGSTEISVPFARISGSGKTRWFPRISDIFSPQNKPGVAYLKPKGFRYSPAVKDTAFSGKTAEFPYKFINPAKPGYADVPLIKAEIEAVFRPEAGTYGLESTKYYTKIKGVRVPIDVFGYTSTPTTTPQFVSGKYGGYKTQPIIDPTVGITSKVSIPSITYSYGKPSYRYSAPSGPALSSSIFGSSLDSSTMGSYALVSSYIPSRTSKISSSLSSSIKGYSSNILGSSAIVGGKSSLLTTPLFFPPLGFGEVKVKKKKGKRKYKRQPSLVAAELNIKSFKPAKGEFTGLVARPLI